MLIGWFSTLSKNGYCSQLFFLIGWKFKLILIRNHMCDRTAVFQVNGRPAICSVGILLAIGKHFHDSTISLRWEFWSHKTSLTQIFFYWSVYNKPGEWEVMYLCVRGFNFASFYNFSIRFWNCSDSVVFFVYHFIQGL